MTSLILKTKNNTLKLLVAALASIQLLVANNIAFAEEQAPIAIESATPADAPKAGESSEAEPPWNLLYTLSFVSDYRARGISQTYLAPTSQASIDLTHESGFYGGVWASQVTNDSSAGAHEEIDAYVGFGNEIKAVEGLSYTTGIYGYLYPGANYSKFSFLTQADGTKRHQSYDTFEAMGGLTYKWLTAKAWVTLNDYYGQNRKTGWTRSTRGSTYFELAANVPLPFYGLNFIAGVGRTHVPGKVSADPLFAAANGNPVDGALVDERTLDYTDYRIGITKSFTIKDSATWNIGVTYIGTTNSGKNDYWGKNGYGGSSVIEGNEGQNVGRDTVLVNVGITF